MKNFELNNNNLTLLQEKAKLYTYLSGKLDKAYFKVSTGKFVFALQSGDGEIVTTFDIDYDGETQYYSVEYSKWMTALQKFAGADSIKISLSDSLLRLKVDGISDVINLGVITYDECSNVARMVDEFIPQRKTDIQNFNYKLTLTEEVLRDFDLMNNLFSTQNRTNSIGVSETDIMYSDRGVVVKANLAETLPEDLFGGLSPDDTHIYLHSFTLKLFEFLKPFNDEVYFDDEYDVLYWGDDRSELVIYSEAKSVSLPTQEQFDSIKPANPDTCFEINLDTLRESLNFFIGFYEGSAWKPIKFILEAGKDTSLRYSHPTADINKALPGVVSNFDAEFTLNSETLGKILQKIKEGNPDKELVVRFNFDENSVPEDQRASGVYCTVGTTYEFIMAKLLED